MPLLRPLVALIFAAALAGCGFHLRGVGSGNLPYKTMFISLPETAEVNIWLQRYIKASGSTEIVDEAKQADGMKAQMADVEALKAELAKQQREGLVPALLVQRREGLVQQQGRRPRRQRPPQRDLLALPAAQPSRTPVQQGLQFESA